MANNKIFLKRTSTSSTRPTTSTIAASELAINLTDGILFSSNGTTIFEVGANTTNSTVTDTLILRDKVNANGGLGTATQFLTSGGSTTNTYWSTVSGGGGTPGGSNTQVQFNSSGSFGGSAGFTFTFNNNNAVIANTFTTGSGYNQTGNGSSVNATLIAVGNSSTRVEANQTTILVGNSSANITLVSNSTALGVRLANSTQSVNVMTTGVHTIPILAASMYTRSDSGVTFNNSTSASFAPNTIRFPCIVFNATSNTFAQFIVPAPKSWNGGSINASFIWYSRAPSTGNAGWMIRGGAINASQNAAAAGVLSSYSSVTQAFVSITEFYVTSNVSLTLAGTPQSNSLLIFEVGRDITVASNFNGAVNLIGVKLFFTLDKGNDL